MKDINHHLHNHHLKIQINNHPHNSKINPINNIKNPRIVTIVYSQTNSLLSISIYKNKCHNYSPKSIKIAIVITMTSLG